MVPMLHNILKGSTSARDNARRLVGVGGPEHNNALSRFAEEVQQAEDELILRIEKPSLIEIFNALDSATGWAEAFGIWQPEHHEAASRFIHDMHQIGLELQTACRIDTSSQTSRQGITTDAVLYDIVSCLTRARAHASFVSEQQPEYTLSLKRFQEEIQGIQGELMEKVRPVFLPEEN
jgi:hypothetical protein